MKVREVTSKSKRLTHLTVWLGIAVLVIAGLVAKDSLVEFYWLSKLDSEIEAERKVAAIKLGEIKSVRAVPRLVRQMIRNAERLLPQMENMGVRERLTKKLQLNGSRVSTSDAFRTLHDVTGLNFVATRSFPEEGEVTFPPKGERNTVAEVVEHLLEQLEIDGVYYVQDGAVILGVPTVRVRKHAAASLPEKKTLWASESLSTIGPRAVPILLELLTDDRVFVRIAAVFTLGEMSALGLSPVPALTERLQDEVPFVRVLATIALARIGPEAAEAIPALKKATKDRNLALSVRASQALRAIQGDSYLK